MALLTIFQTDDQSFRLMQNSWARILNPIIQNKSTNPLILENVSLTTGSNVINHKLGQKLNGWKIIRQRASASVFDTQDSNQTPQLTLQLTSSANVVVDLEVF